MNLRISHGQIGSAMVDRAMLRRTYDWCIAAADKPYALWILAAVAFAESSFFPVPPDVMLLPMALARPQRAWLFATVCTIASVAGGVLGYAIGALLYDSVGQWLIHLYGLGDKVEAFRASYAHWGAWIIIGKGLTPIPYKLVTITSGFAGYDVWLFILCSIIARGGPLLHRRDPARSLRRRHSPRNRKAARSLGVHRGCRCCPGIRDRIPLDLKHHLAPTGRAAHTRGAFALMNRAELE
jgi:membrane protein YqaA with SNARE-associated domain